MPVVNSSKGKIIMSAFVCGNDHFKVLAIFAASRIGGYGQGHMAVDPKYIKGCEGLAGKDSRVIASEYADILYRENIRSVSARYPSDKRDELPGQIVKPLRMFVTAQDECSPKYRLKAVSILKMCNGLEYQSCETKNYRTTLAFDLLDSIRRAAIKTLPGYDDAPWDYDASEKAAA